MPSHTYLHPSHLCDGLYLEGHEGTLLLANGLPLPTVPTSELSTVEFLLNGELQGTLLFHDEPGITGHKVAFHVGDTLYFYYRDKLHPTRTSPLTLLPGACFELVDVERR